MPNLKMYHCRNTYIETVSKPLSLKLKPFRNLTIRFHSYHYSGYHPVLYHKVTITWCIYKYVYNIMSIHICSIINHILTILNPIRNIVLSYRILYIIHNHVLYTRIYIYAHAHTYIQTSVHLIRYAFIYI